MGCVVIKMPGTFLVLIHSPSYQELSKQFSSMMGFAACIEAWVQLFLATFRHGRFIFQFMILSKLLLEKHLLA